MRRSPRPGSAATPHKHNPDFYSDRSNSSVSATSRDSGSRRGSRRSLAGWKLSTDSCAPQQGGASSLWLSTELSGNRPVQQQTRTTKTVVLQTLRFFPAVFGEILGAFCREVRSLRFLITASLFFCLFAAAIWGAFLYFTPVWDEETREFLTLRGCPLSPAPSHAPASCSLPALCSLSPATPRSEYHEKVHSQGLQLQQLQAELDKLHTDVSSIRAANSERVAQLVFQRLNEDFVQKPDYALSSVGASIDLDKTSHDYEDRDTAYFWNRFSFWNYAKPPTVILEPDVFPGNCWAFKGAKGQVVIRLPGRVQLSDITLQHPPPSVAHSGGASSAPRDFAVFGLQGDDKTEVFLGRFIFDVEKSEIQTFHLKNEPPIAFPKVKIQILSNWGHPRFTCLYRVRAHGLRSHDGHGEDSRTKGERNGASETTTPH
ncbi:sperm-associated antigen 4 protein isoform X2 [Monodelphis domestica]|uniref:sperm-associated antigen 4 protein isoform X2 n=1 Tax=Monodelphis domestica TaxID=13616 RepID=UPI0024E22146|nr:sperm-associated antigen 4 protein isoform X2 [Monodelphis domestica]